MLALVLGALTRPAALAPDAHAQVQTIAFGPPPTGLAFENMTDPGIVNVSEDLSLLTLTGNDRVYKVEDYKVSKWSDVRYSKLKLLGKTLSWTADYSRVKCGCNAAMYLVAMDTWAKNGSSGYCDVQMGSSACLEIDLQEGNCKAIQTTLHTRFEDKPPSGLSDGVCNQWGCATNWGKDDSTSYQYGYGPRSGIDSSRPYRMDASFDDDGAMTLTASQDAKRIDLWDVKQAGNPSGRGVPPSETAATKAAMEKGLVLVFSLWTAKPGDMAWLDGGCNDEYKQCNLNTTHAVFSDIVVSPNA